MNKCVVGVSVIVVLLSSGVICWQSAEGQPAPFTPPPRSTPSPSQPAPGPKNQIIVPDEMTQLRRDIEKLTNSMQQLGIKIDEINDKIDGKKYTQLTDEIVTQLNHLCYQLVVELGPDALNPRFASLYPLAKAYPEAYKCPPHHIMGITPTTPYQSTPH